MLIDSHAHIGDTPNFHMHEEILVESMKKYNIDFAVISNAEGMEFDCDLNVVSDKYTFSQIELNSKLLSFVKKNFDRFKGLFWIKPHLEGYSEEIETFILENKAYFSGLKLHPYHSKIRITDKKLLPYLKFANKHSLTFLVHTAADEYSRAIYVYELAGKYPNIKFILGHMDLGSDNKEAISYIKKLPNLYGDTTWVSTASVLYAVDQCSSEKILFGTDSPIDGIDTYSKYLNTITEIKDKLPKEAADNVLYKNAQRLFALNNL